MTDDLDDIECVAMVLASQLGHAAARFAYKQTEIADALLDVPSADTWRDIGRAIERLPRAARTEPVRGQW